MQADSISAVKQRADTSRVPGYLDFSVTVVAADGAATVRVTGDLDCYTSPQLRDTLATLVREGTRDVTVDVAATQFIDSTGLSVLVGGLKQLRESGGTMVVRGPSPATLKLFEVTGLQKVFEIA